MFISTQGQYSKAPTKNGGGLVSSSSDSERVVKKATGGRAKKSNRTGTSKKAGEKRSRFWTAGKRPEADARISQVGKAMAEANANGLSMTILFEEWHQEVTPLSTPPRSLVQLFTDWDLPEKVGVVRDLGTRVVSRMPVITDRLVGGEEAALKMWELLVLMGKEGIMFHSAAMASGNFWDVLTEAELIIEGLGQHKKFRDLYRDVEQGPLNHYFTGHLGPPIKWGFTSLRQAREAIPSREPGQFFDFMAKSLAFLVLDRAQSINAQLRPISQRQLEDNTTAGKRAPKRKQEGAWHITREARVILRRIGVELPELSKEEQVNYYPDEDLTSFSKDDLQLALYISDSTVQLAKELLNTVGQRETAFGIRRLEVRDLDSKIPAARLTFTILAHAAAIIESELLTLYNFPHHHGKSIYDARIALDYSEQEVAILQRHREALEKMQEAADRDPNGKYAPLVKIINQINEDYKLHRIDYTDVFPDVGDPARM